MVTTNDAASADDPPSDPTRRIRLPLAVILVGGVTLLILLAVGSVLTLTLLSATTNTFSLLGHRATITLDLLEAHIGNQLDPVVTGAQELGKMFADGRLNLEDRRARTFDTAGGVLSVLPQATAVVFIRQDGVALRVATAEGFLIEVPETPRIVERQSFALAAARQSRKPFWLPPLWLPTINQAVFTQIVPVWRGEEFYGVVVVSVTLDKITRFLETLESEENLSAFILYDRRFVLGHPRLLESNFEADLQNPLPGVDDVNEPAFRMLDGASERATHLLSVASNVTDARISDEYIVITREIRRYGDTPWTIGLRFPRAEATVELERLRETAFAGAAILIIAALSGYLLARALNVRIGRLAATAEALQGLEMSKVPRMPDSRLVELSNAARAFNAMVGALRLFETYVPKPLVLRLMHSPDDAARSDTRELTILFTDIVGFSTLAENMSAAQTANFLNSHFTLVAACIEAEGGTVDKYIGDSLMAFWGAPEMQSDHAVRALRAAAAIRSAVITANAARRAQGEPAIPVRVGVHTGPAVVGNIGAPSRVNYTVVGDTVNTASRLEALPKELGLTGDCVVLVSGDTQHAAGPHPLEGASLTPIGEQELRGRGGKIAVYQLEIK